MRTRNTVILILTILATCLRFASAQRPRDCTCTQRLHVAKSEKYSRTLRTGNGTDTSRDECDFDCPEYCAEEVRLDLGNAPDVITSEGFEEMCNRIYDDRALFKDGIVVTANWELRTCDLDDVPKAYEISNNNCCRYCNCTYGITTLWTNGEETVNFSEQVRRPSRHFKCDELDANQECEMDCRRELAGHLKFPEIYDDTSEDKYEILEHPTVADQFCEDYGRSIYSPGVELNGYIETGPKDQSWHKEISMGNLCCKRRCECKLYFKVLNDRNDTLLFDLTSSLKQRPPRYDCSLEFSDCMEDCRRELAGHLKFPELNDMDVDKYEILDHPRVADQFCEDYGRSIYSPGVELYGYLETGALDRSRHKEISMGNLCCKRQCKCQLFYRIWNDKQNETLISDLTSQLKQRPPSYDCGLELSDCLEDCRLETGVLIKNPEFTDVTKSPLDVNPLEVFATARKICMLIGKNTRADGIKVYLRYQTAESDAYPRAQDLLLGHLCCSKYLGVDYFPFNNCKPWDVSVPIDLNDN